MKTNPKPLPTHKPLRCLALALLILAAAPAGLAKPWIGPDDLALRQHIELLAATGIIRAPITQWPLMWSSIAGDLRQAQHQKLTNAQRNAVNHLRNAYEDAKAPLRFSIEGGAGELARPYLVGFGDSNFAQDYAIASAAFVSHRWAGELSVGYDLDDEPREQQRLDGSYLVGAFGNWALGVAAIDRWWGPGWQSSLVLSQNARPVPGLMVQRNRATPFETPLLSWLGTWQFQAFAGQLESDRAVDSAKLLGARVSLKPLSWLELGFSRTAQWGGEGRPESFDSFKDLVLGNDNVGDDGITEDNEPGNQLGGFDIKLGFVVPWGTQGAYLQVLGEDEAGLWPSRSFYMAGLDGILTAGDHRLHWFFEHAETTVGAWDGEKRPGSAYGNRLYGSGYTYEGRNLGPSIGGDSESDTLGVSWVLPSANSLVLRISDVDYDINPNANTVAASGDSIDFAYHFTLWCGDPVGLLKGG